MEVMLVMLPIAEVLSLSSLHLPLSYSKEFFMVLILSSWQV